MKKIFLIALLISAYTLVFAQEKSYDSIAVVILDHMSDIIGDLSSCSFIVHSSGDVNDESGVVTHYETDEVFFSGPDKMLVQVKGDNRHNGYWYNSSTLSYYSYKENNYAVIDAPANILDAIDTVNENYGIDFPAADFFYPSFTDDLIVSSDNISFEGISTIDDKRCFHITANNKDMSVQFWISNDALFLPVKMVINYRNNKKTKRYEASFSNWNLNPDLPSSMFEFSPPPGANQVALLSRK